MGTPHSLRLILSPKFLSPLSPIAHNFYKKDSQLKPYDQKKLLHGKNIAKRLNFTNLTKELEINHLNVKEAKNLEKKTSHEKKIYDENGILHSTENIVQKSQISPCKSLDLNTPNKTEIFRNGVDKYKEIKILGKGTFGTVVKGIFKEKEVAIKIVKNDENDENFTNELNALDLNHKNVIKIFDVIHSDLKYSIVIMECLCKSKDLQLILDFEYKKLNNITILNFAKDICSAIKYCHEKSLYHLDVKPKNIMVDYNGVCKICDFGNSFKKGKKNYIFQGTVAYAAPELLKGFLPTEKCDIYSLGITLWQIKNKKHPYENMENIEILIYKVVKFNMRPSVSTQSSQGDQINIKFEDTWENLCVRCWSANAELRPSLNKIEEELNNLFLSL